jgi:hypothetical protein
LEKGRAASYSVQAIHPPQSLWPFLAEFLDKPAWFSWYFLSRRRFAA